jgi:hypothetical protein
LIEAVWSYRFSARNSRNNCCVKNTLGGPDPGDRLESARLCLQHPSRAGKPITTVTTAIAR